MGTIECCDECSNTENDSSLTECEFCHEIFCEDCYNNHVTENHGDEVMEKIVNLENEIANVKGQVEDWKKKYNQLRYSRSKKK